jgi:hypothetical protein
VDRYIKDTAGLVGEICENMCDHLALLSAAFDIPLIISGGCHDPSMTNTRQFSTLVQVSPSSAMFAEACVQMLKYFK